MAFQQTMRMITPGGTYTNVSVEVDEDYIYLSGGFPLKDEFKVMRGAKWLGREKENPLKAWRVHNCPRNQFNLAYLRGEKPHDRWLKPLDLSLARTQRVNCKGQIVPFYIHQREMTAHIRQNRHVIVAGEMGVGKTLSAIESIDLSNLGSADEIWYIGPKPALTSIRLEHYLWLVRQHYVYMTYDELKKVLSSWPAGKKPPRFVVFDESSRLKNGESQRSLAAQHLADAMRQCYGYDCWIVEMTGSPAPKSPLDWYSQCEIAAPGFLREGNLFKFKERLACIEAVTDDVGYKYGKLQAWRDGNANICNTCGYAKDNAIHEELAMITGYHAFVPLQDEVSKLYRRMKGLVLVKLKKDCLDLPEKIFRRINIKPSQNMMRAAKMVAVQAKSAIQLLTLHRELSDGFQYKIEKVEIPCESCIPGKECLLCGDTGKQTKDVRTVVRVDSPKLDTVTDLMEEVEDDGRIVLYAGFTESIDRTCEHVHKLGWDYIRIDGRGWHNTINSSWNDEDCVRAFQRFTNSPESDRKIAVVAHPASAGMGLTLTASSMFVYISNDFSGEARIQSMNRGHRPGMTKAVTIADLILLPTDQKVIDNLDRKLDLQSMSMGDIQSVMDTSDYSTPSN